MNEYLTDKLYGSCVLWMFHKETTDWRRCHTLAPEGLSEAEAAMHVALMRMGKLSLQQRCRHAIMLYMCTDMELNQGPYDPAAQHVVYFLRRNGKHITDMYTTGTNDE